MRSYYAMTMDRALRITTRIVWGAVWLPPAGALAAVYFGGAARRDGAALGWGAAAVAVFLGLVLYFTRALAPRGLILDDVDLTVDRAMSPLTIPLREVTEARKAAPEELKRAIRLFGASGFYAHYGWFWTKQLGRFRMYSRRLNDLVLVTAAGRRYALGPDSPDEFLADLGKLIRR